MTLLLTRQEFRAGPRTKNNRAPRKRESRGKNRGGRDDYCNAFALEVRILVRARLRIGPMVFSGTPTEMLICW